MAGQLQETLKELPDISEITIIGGRPRQRDGGPRPGGAFRPPSRSVVGSAGAHARQRPHDAARHRLGQPGDSTRDRRLAGVAGRASRTSSSATADGTPVHLADVATVTDGGGEPDDYVMHYPRPGQAFPAVTLSIAKRKGTNAITLTRAVERKIDTTRGYLLPRDLNVSITRNYGETAAQKSNELLWHMLLAIVSVSALIWLVLGRRESAVVLTAIPVTLALTLFVFYLYGYTLNRITLFALIFSIGILVDDAIVVVENIVRHAPDVARRSRRSKRLPCARWTRSGIRRFSRR